MEHGYGGLQVRPGAHPDGADHGAPFDSESHNFDLFESTIDNNVGGTPNPG